MIQFHVINLPKTISAHELNLKIVAKHWDFQAQDLSFILDQRRLTCIHRRSRGDSNKPQGIADQMVAEVMKNGERNRNQCSIFDYGLDSRE